MNRLISGLFIFLSLHVVGQNYLRLTDTVVFGKAINDSSFSNKKIATYSTNSFKLQNTDNKSIVFEYYSGQPFKKLIGNFTYINPSENILKGSEFILPNSSAYYLNTSSVTVLKNQNYLSTNHLSDEKINDLLIPFYLLNHEVSNLEYRIFINYVRDSIARRILGEEFPDEFLIPTYDQELKENN